MGGRQRWPLIEIKGSRLLTPRPALRTSVSSLPYWRPVAYRGRTGIQDGSTVPGDGEFGRGTLKNWPVSPDE